MAGITMQHDIHYGTAFMEHSMSAYHHNLPHGAGLIMIQGICRVFMAERHACDEQFVKMAKVMIADAAKPEDFITADLLGLRRLA